MPGCYKCVCTFLWQQLYFICYNNTFPENTIALKNNGKYIRLIAHLSKNMYETIVNRYTLHYVIIYHSHDKRYPGKSAIL